MEAKTGNGGRLDALDRLQTSLRDRKIDFGRWERELKAERRSSTRRLSPKRR